MFERSVFLSDAHIPFESEQAMNTAIAFVRHFKPHFVFIMGDFLDFYGASRFGNKDPRRINHLSEELKRARYWLEKIRHASDAKIFYLQGNHCSRLLKYIRDHAPELHDIEELNIPNLLKLREQDIKYIPDSLRFHGFLIKHGTVVRSKSGYTATGELELSGISGISGHTHRLAEVYRTNQQGMLKWVEVGCLCDLNPEYMEGQVTNWQHGLAYGYFEKKGNKFTVHTVPIIKGKLVFAGKVIHG